MEQARPIFSTCPFHFSGLPESKRKISSAVPGLLKVYGCCLSQFVHEAPGLGVEITDALMKSIQSQPKAVEIRLGQNPIASRTSSKASTIGGPNGPFLPGWVRIVAHYRKNGYSATISIKLYLSRLPTSLLV
jgi:hypothetical protein